MTILDAGAEAILVEAEVPLVLRHLLAYSYLSMHSSYTFILLRLPSHELAMTLMGLVSLI